MSLEAVMDVSISVLIRKYILSRKLIPKLLACFPFLCNELTLYIFVKQNMRNKRQWNFKLWPFSFMNQTGRYDLNTSYLRDDVLRQSFSGNMQGKGNSQGLFWGNHTDIRQVKRKGKSQLVMPGSRARTCLPPQYRYEISDNNHQTMGLDRINGFISGFGIMWETRRSPFGMHLIKKHVFETAVLK